MNRQHQLIVSGLLSLMAAAASAEDSASPYPSPFASNLTRAEVMAQALAARAPGGVEQDAAVSSLPPKLSSTKSRAEVTAEVIEARRLGLLALNDGQERELTPAEAEQIRMAGLRARFRDSAAAAY